MVSANSSSNLSLDSSAGLATTAAMHAAMKIAITNLFILVDIAIANNDIIALVVKLANSLLRLKKDYRSVVLE